MDTSVPLSAWGGVQVLAGETQQGLPTYSSSTWPARSSSATGRGISTSVCRLRWRRSGAQGRGVVTVVEKSADGNWEMSIKPDPGWETYTKGHPDGTFRAEIVPADQANVPTPSVGEHIRVTGSWVTDHEHEWDQIHPVWKLEKV